MTDDEFDKLLKGALKRQTPQRDEAAVNRVLNRLAGPLPRQRMRLWQWPAVLLDWQFAPAWPRVAALAGCLALGFVLGISGLDPRIAGARPTGDSGSLGFVIGISGLDRRIE